MSESFKKNTGKLLAGNVVGQVIGIMAIPIITRLYSVEVYGTFAVLLSVCGILSTISTLGLYLAILIPKSDIEARNIVVMSFSIMSTFCMITLLVLINYPTEISNLLGIPLKGWLVYSIPLLVFLQGAYLILSYWCVREKKFGAVAGSRVIEGVLDRCAAIGFALVGFASAVSLIVSRLLSSLLSALYLLKFLNRNKSIDEHSHVNACSGYSELLIKYRRYLQYNAPSMLLISSMLQLPTVLFAAYYSPVAAGYYAIANRIVSIPIQTLGGALSKTYTQHVATEFSVDNMYLIKRDTEKIFSKIFAFLLIPFSMLCIAGQELFSLVLGDSWQEAGVIAQSLSFFAMTSLLAQAFGGLFDVLERQKVRFVFHVLNFLVRIGTLVVCVILKLDLVVTVICYSVMSTIMNLIVLHILFIGIDSPNLLVKTVFGNVKYISLFFVAVFFCYEIFDGEVFRLLIVCLLSIIWFVSLVGVDGFSGKSIKSYLNI